jgi:transcriptional regulator with XRE-family HTH domain
MRSFGSLDQAGIAAGPDESGQTVHVAGAPGSQASLSPKRPVQNAEHPPPTSARAPDALVTDHQSLDRLGSDGCGVNAIDGCADVVSASAAIVIATPRIPNTVTVAVEFGKAGQGWAGAIVFNLWLRRQLRERRMSQRQLAHLSGVDHSTISRLIAGDRTPSLDTAAKLARALHVSSDEIGTELGFVDGRPALPTQRVEAALRGDADLDDADVRALMEAYIARRRRPKLRAVDGAARDRGAQAASGRDPPA